VSKYFDRGAVRLRKRFALLVLSGVILLSCVFPTEFGLFQAAGAADSFPIHNVNTGLNYSSIQAAVDASETLDGHTVIVDAGTYAEHLVVDKSLAIVGGGRDRTSIDGGGAGYVVQVVAKNVLIKGFEVKDGLFGIFVDHSDNCVLSDNSVTNVSDFYAIYVSYSQNCTIKGNIVGPNSASGILVTNSVGFMISENLAFGNSGYGLNANASMNGLFSWNEAVANSYDGIGLGKGSSNCTVFGNNVTDNLFYGIWLDSDSSDNLIYDNNIIDNGMQVSVNLANRWDSGVEGNFWSNYSGADSDMNGIVDAPFVLWNGNVDNHPLAGEFQSFETVYGYRVNIVSNSTVENFSFSELNGTIRFTSQESASSQDYGFFRMSIPHGLMIGPFNVTMDETSPVYANYSLYDDGDSRWIFFNFQNLTGEILVEGVDRTVPTVSMILPQSKTYDTSNVLLVFVVNELPAWMAYSLDGQGNVTIDGNITIEGVSNGTHYVTVYSRDFAGNTGASNTIYFNVDVPGTPFVYWALLVVVIVAVVLVSIFIWVKRSKNKTKHGN
jgi:parallel beta-helix repeat protein